MLAQIDLDAPVTLKAAEKLSVAELATTYAGTDVEPHRFLAPAIFDEIGIDAAESSIGIAAGRPPAVTPDSEARRHPADVRIDRPVRADPVPRREAVADVRDPRAQGASTSSKIIATLLQTDGDTSYEELGCIGYDPVEDALVGVLTVKKPNGYSGGACTAGSVEYVAFWVDWGGGWSYAGTAGVVVHDEACPTAASGSRVYLPLVVRVPSTRLRRGTGRAEGARHPVVEHASSGGQPELGAARGATAKRRRSSCRWVPSRHCVRCSTSSAA